MKLSISLLLFSLFATGLQAQDPVRVNSPQEDSTQDEPARQDPDFKPPRVVRLTDMERLFHAYGISHGGRQELKNLEVLSFRVIPLTMSEEGEQELSPIHVDAQLNGIDRMMRLEEEIDGRSVVKFADGMQEVSTFVNGELRDIPELKQGALEESLLFYVLLDLLYKPESPDFKSEYRSRKKRNGQEYLTADFEFHTSRMLPHTYRLFYHPEDGFVRRIDVHDTRTMGNLRMYSMYISEYDVTAEAKVAADNLLKSAEEQVEAAENPQAKAKAEEALNRVKLSLRTPKFPGRVEFVSREGEPFVVWRMVDFVANGEFEPGYFSEP